MRLIVLRDCARGRGRLGPLSTPLLLSAAPRGSLESGPSRQAHLRSRNNALRWSMRWAPIWLCSAFAGCAPATGDALVDRTVARVAPLSNCVSLYETQITKQSDEPGAPSLLVARSFENRAARNAASKVAVRWRTLKHRTVAHFGPGAADDCGTQVGRPLYSGDYAFVSYSEPGGVIGAFAYRRKDDGWHPIEHVHLGYW